MNDIKRKEIIKYLKLLANGYTPIEKYLGICGVLKTEYNVIIEGEVDFSKWPSFSGNPFFPVPSPCPDIKADKCFSHTDNMWVGRYGILRRGLCLWIANELERRLGEDNGEI